METYQGSKQEHKGNSDSALADKRYGKENSFQISLLIVNTATILARSAWTQELQGKGIESPGGEALNRSPWSELRETSQPKADFGLLCREICAVMILKIYFSLRGKIMTLVMLKMAIPFVFIKSPFFFLKKHANVYIDKMI